MNRPSLDLAVLDRRTLGNAVLRNDLLRLFREHGPPALARMTAAIDARDSMAVTAAAHRLKGSAATIAATALADMGRRVEAAAAAGDWTTVADELIAVDTEFRLCLQQIDLLLTPVNGSESCSLL